MAKIITFPKAGVGRVELYRAGTMAIIIEASTPTIEAAEVFEELSGRPKEVYLRRLARRIADAQGFDAPPPRGQSR